MNIVTPGLFTNGLTYPQFATALSSTRLCVLGGATKGPLNKPLLCKTVGDLIANFGGPVLNDLGIQSAIQYLQAGYQLIYTRVAHTPTTATQNVQGYTGGTAAQAATGYVQFSGSVQPNNHDYLSIGDGVRVLTFEFTSDNSVQQMGAIAVGIGTTAAATMANFITAINSSNLTITAVNPNLSSPRANLTNRVPGTAGNVAITLPSVTIFSASSGSVGASSGRNDNAAIVVAGMSGGTAAIVGTLNNVITFSAINPGSWGNNISITITVPTVVVGAPNTNFDLAISAPPQPGAASAVIEKFTNLSTVSTAANFIDAVLANGIPGQFNASNYVVSTTLAAATPSAGTYALGTGGGTAGTDGIAGLVDADYIGTVNGNTATGLQAVTDPEFVAYSLLAIPGNSSAAVITAAQANAQTRGDHIYLVDPPLGLTEQQVVQWVNGAQPAGVPNAPATPLASQYMSISWPWAQVYDPFNNRNIWLPPSAITAMLMASADSKAGPWLPAAGPSRGVASNVLQLEVNISQAQRGDAYANNINPFIMTSAGAVRYGQITLQRDPTQIQSESAVRTVIFCQGLCAGTVRFLVFEANNANTRRKFVDLCNAALANVLSAQGLQSATVTCDANTNPASQSTKVLTGVITIVPVNIAEQINMGFSATPSSTTFTTPSTASLGN